MLKMKPYCAFRIANTRKNVLHSGSPRQGRKLQPALKKVILRASYLNSKTNKAVGERIIPVASDNSNEYHNKAQKFTGSSLPTQHKSNYCLLRKEPAPCAA
ncbi:hypothetical protein C5167_025187 [Papaver somniferum]|uniref:Uncharacterized protein n=1 Tax=Papaver somniferum TaxID=3469 RepID=A0A4Y7JRT4_PAPSO|nr:hypothetical protein C5167_025187 [Papaver somniferum]